MAYGDPFDSVLNLQQALDAIRDSDWLKSGTSGGGAYPPINVFRKGEDLVAVAEVPGIEKKDIEVQVRGNVVRIAGTAVLATQREELAMGFYHSFSGWLVFVTSCGILLLIARGLHRYLD